MMGYFFMGKRCLILFLSYRCGTPFEVRDVTSFTPRIVPLEAQIETGAINTTKSMNRYRRERKRTLVVMQNHIADLNNQMKSKAASFKQSFDERCLREPEELRAKRFASLEFILRLKQTVVNTTAP